MIYLDLLLKATKGQLFAQGSQIQFTAFSHDSRQLLPGELFVAVHGERSDGHNYLLDAIQSGAAGLLVEGRVFNALSQDTLAGLAEANTTIVVVDDTRVALREYSMFILQEWHPTVIAVTGSVGKTSTKEAIASVLSSSFATFRSWQNYNDLLGLPLSLGRLEKRHEYAVVELGCDHPGEIMQLCQIARPDIGIVTNISPVQMQYFVDIEQLAHELLSLFTTLRERGTAIFNSDDEWTRKLLPQLPVYKDSTYNFLSFTPSLARDIQATWNGVQCTLSLHTEQADTEDSIRLASHLLGVHSVATLLATYVVARRCGLQPSEIQQALAQLQPLAGRLNPLGGVYGARLLDDTHNASPLSTYAGLETLKALPAGRRMAILGDMLALGDFSSEAHMEVGREAARSVDYLITRGERTALIAEAAQQAGLPAERVVVTSTHEDAARAAQRFLERSGEEASATSVLIKGSEETRMEKVTELLMAHPSEAPERLVRQTPGWKQIVVMRPDRPTWVEIDLSAIGSNTRRIKEIVGPRVRVLVSLKADAYGHGALKVARTALHNGASMLGVATVSEAAPLREAGITAPILVFGYVPPWQMREAVRLGVTVTLYAPEAAQALSRAALALGKRVKVHVKIDTGMARLGVRAEQSTEVMRLIASIVELKKEGLEFEGIYTHLACADSSDATHSLLQLSRFRHVLQLLEKEGWRPPIVHAANSAATLSLPQARFDMVRPGIAIYGLDPSEDVRLPEGFCAALSFKTQVSQVKVLPAGECISYGCTYVTERPTRIAVLPVGYADGFRRAPRNWGAVLIAGQEAPLLGRVCMDQCIVDVTHIAQEVRMGDEVVLIGRQGQATLTAEQVAERLGTINYEVVSEILARVPRVD
ncbi:MAG: alanine racemase [Ktedonobacteraceae bacterium]|nr:alanine racemase [Ktedonobacteraceae bacterium]